MNNLSNFKTKIFVCELVFISILAVTGLIVFAVGPSTEEHKETALQTVESSSAAVKPSDKVSVGIPVVVLDDGKTSRALSIDEFLKLVKSSKIDAVVPTAQVGNLADLIRLQNDAKKQNEEIEILRTLAKNVEKLGKKPQDAWWLEGWKEGLKFPKEKIRSAGIFLIKALVGGTICGLMCVGGVWLGYKFILQPAYCGSGMSNIPWLLSYIPVLGRFIHPSLYGVCDSYYGAQSLPQTGLPGAPNLPADCNCDARFLSAQCVGECFPS